MKDEARLDKWLWAARIFKTRTIAAAACKKGQVSIKFFTLSIIFITGPPYTSVWNLLCYPCYRSSTFPPTWGL